MELPENSLEILHISEPDLEFGHGQFCDHPKDGLFLYGPHEGQPATQQISVAIIGTEHGIAHFHTWAAKASTLVPIPERGKRDKEHRLHLSDFPGLEEAFGLAIDPRIVARTIDGKELDERTRTLNHHEAVKTAVGLYLAEIEAHGKNEEQKVDVWVLILPELVFERCKPESKRTGLGLLKGSFGKRQTTRSDLPLLAGVLDQTEEAIFDDFPDFHRQVKAQLLKVGVPSQLVRETTLSPDSFKNKAGYNTRRLQDPASVAWNGKGCRPAAI